MGNGYAANYSEAAFAGPANGLTWLDDARNPSIPVRNLRDAVGVWTLSGHAAALEAKAPAVPQGVVPECRVPACLRLTWSLR